MKIFMQKSTRNIKCQRQTLKSLTDVMDSVPYCVNDSTQSQSEKLKRQNETNVDLLFKKKH